jgi:hypothetical protein
MTKPSNSEANLVTVTLGEVSETLELTHEAGAWYAAIQGTIPSRRTSAGRIFSRVEFEAYCKAHPLDRNHESDSHFVRAPRTEGTP